MKVGVIADDLTGANATGVKLINQGFQSATMVHYDQPLVNGSFNAVCIDTDSRYASEEVSRMRLKRSLYHLNEWGATVICKRIDSTVRGHIGREITSLLHLLGDSSIAIVVASYPESKRITSGGYLLVDGIPVQSTDVAKDPVLPLTESHVPSIIQRESNLAVGHIGLENVLRGPESIFKELVVKINEGNRIIVVDAIADEEIEDIASAMIKIDSHRLIPVDPGPLTSYYAKAVKLKKEKGQKIIVTLGSVTSLSAKQLSYLVKKTESKPVYVDATKLASISESWEAEVQRASHVALNQLQDESVLIITTHDPSAERMNLEQRATELNVSQDLLAKRIADGLGKITRLVIEQTTDTIGGCFSSGGDVTASLCSIGRAEGIHLKSEIIPLVAFGEFIGGYFDGIPLATKGGMVGDEKSMHTIIKYLQANRLNKEEPTIYSI
ncbi:four-carbon acid sugar kinase family protein [Exiguobacterium sp. UBA3968]|uniref:four-carbon acid sugar kinase family protein n=1 Tax=Exiguobacterium sp. UBA3968 TaxID=1946492 RepID=UPI0025C42208|nr:four-carbon acid sugar kinase family protein [Exiguobacterium sp. UBA3968]